MAPVKTVKNILMELRKVCQHPYLSAPDLENLEAPEDEQQKQLIDASGKLVFLKLLLPKLKERGHRVLLFSQFKIALDRIEDFLYGEQIQFLRLDGDVQQAQRQKSMDLFNAPNSEYDVFLLTTRAGGVGINLATADTVIIYDPDFNPHQDLQAIARSHRYGQTKKVLVFKLMVKGSVEENIINKGKKKMVLDHLVVQQMNKENEEGDVDNLLLQGAEAVYSNQGGINIPDIVYNSKNVDELIDKVEADAEAEATAMTEREQAIANGDVEPARAAAAQFGFAKIWEAEQNELRELEEEIEDRGAGADRTGVDWQAIFETMQREKEAREEAEAEGQRAKRRKAADGQVRYKIDGHHSDSTPKKNGKGKKNDKWRNTSSSDNGDTEYAIGQDNDSSDDEEEAYLTSVPEQAGDLTDEHGNLVHSKLVDPGKRSKKHLRKMELNKMLDAAVVMNGETNVNGVNDGNAVAGPSVQPVIDSGDGSVQGEAEQKKRRREGETLEERAQRRLRNLARKQKRDAMLVEGGNPPHAPVIDGRPASNGIARPAGLTSAPPITGTNEKYMRAQDVLGWLFQILQLLGLDTTQWALMALPELDPAERWKIYNTLANDVDPRLVDIGQVPFFTLTEQKYLVSKLFDDKAPSIPDEPRMIPVPAQAGFFRPELLRKQNGTNGAYQQRPVVLVPTHAPFPYRSPPAQHTALSPAPPLIEGGSGSASRRTRRFTPSPPDLLPNNDYGIPSASFSTAPKGIARPAVQGVPSGATPTNRSVNGTPCDECGGAHALRDCAKLVPVDQIDMVYKGILTSNRSAAYKEVGLRDLAAMIPMQVKAGRTLPPHLLQLMDDRIANTSISPKENGSSDDSGNRPRPPIQRISSNVTTPGNSQPLPPQQSAPKAGPWDAAIVIDDDDDVVEGFDALRSQQHQRKTSRNKRHTGCVICGSEQSHHAKQCPVVQAGPASTRQALGRLDSQHALYSVLQTIYHKQVRQQQQQQQRAFTPDRDQNRFCGSGQTNGITNEKLGNGFALAATEKMISCAFCEKACGLAIRTCAQRNGGRKALKDKIRRSEETIKAGDATERQRRNQGEMYECYKQWPRDG